MKQSDKSVETGMGRFVFHVAWYICIAIFLSVGAFGLVWRSDYHFDDFPLFTRNDLWNYVSAAFHALLLLFMFHLFKKRNVRIWLCLLLYAFICIAFMFLVPLEPFSDMKSIFNIANSGMADTDGYLKRYENQIPITLYLYALSFFGKNIIIPKLMNVVFNIWTAYMTYRIGSILFGEDRRILLYTCFFVPPILYINHIYNDTMSAALAVTMTYLALDKQEMKWKAAALIMLSALSVWFRASNILFVLAILLYWMFSLKKWKKALVYVLTVTLLLCGLQKMGKTVVHSDGKGGYPVWSYIQMGLNEEEFGFQDGSHSEDWTFSDCIERIQSLGMKRTVKLLAKKELWMWSEGTYQAERYGFGDVNAEYTTENAVTQNLHTQSNLRKAVVYWMKGQYYVFAVFALLGIFVEKKRNGIELLLYFICGFFCFYLIWEMKSRYIYALYPYMILLAGQGIKWISRIYDKNKNMRKGKEKR